MISAQEFFSEIYNEPKLYKLSKSFFKFKFEVSFNLIVKVTYEIKIVFRPC